MTGILINSLKRLYASSQLTKEDIAERVVHGSITAADYKTITGEEYEG